MKGLTAFVSGLFALLLALATAALPAPPVRAQSSVDDPAQAAIADLAGQLFRDDFCAGGERRSIGIWMFDRDSIPVSETVADRIYATSLNALIAAKPPCVDVLDGSAIREIADHLKRTGAFREAGDNPLLALERANRSVAILVRGEILAQNASVFLSFRAVQRERGVVLAQTKPWPLPDAYVQSAAEDAALSLDVALTRAANQLVARSGGLRILMPLGVYFQDTGAQPPLGRYILAGLLGAIENEASNIVTGSKLRVVSPDLQLTAKSGAAATIDDFDPLAGAGGKIGAGAFKLTGRYWQVGDAIDLKLALRSQTGESVSWQGRVRLSGLPGLQATPRNSALGSTGESAFLLQMTSPRGPAPYYQPGEALTVFLRSERDAWLACFYTDVNGVTMQVLPNKFQPDRSAGSRIAADVLRALPDPRRDPFEFRFTINTLGEEVLRCFAMTRDPARYLPAALQGEGFTPLDEGIASRLGDMFRALPDTLVAEAQLTVTVGTQSPQQAAKTGESKP